MDRDEMQRLIEQGLTFREIGDRIGLTAKGAYKRAHTLGLAPTGRPAQRRELVTVTRACLICGREFTRPQRFMTGRKGRYCSRECVTKSPDYKLGPQYGIATRLGPGGTTPKKRQSKEASGGGVREGV